MYTGRYKVAKFRWRGESFLTNAVSRRVVESFWKMYAYSGDGELKSVAYLRNDRSNCFLPYALRYFPLIRKAIVAGVWQGTQGKGKRGRKRKAEREREGKLKSQVTAWKVAKLGTIRCRSMPIYNRVEPRCFAYILTGVDNVLHGKHRVQEASSLSVPFLSFGKLRNRD